MRTKRIAKVARLISKRNSNAGGRLTRAQVESLARANFGLFTNGKIYATMKMMVDIREYHDQASRSPFREWFDKLNSEASRR